MTPFACVGISIGKGAARQQIAGAEGARAERVLDTRSRIERDCGAELRKRSHVGFLSDASPRGSTSENASKRFHAGTGGVWPSRGTYGEGSVMLMRWM